MTPKQLTQLQQALGTHHLPTLQNLLKVEVRSPDALWHAAQHLTPRGLAALARAAQRSAMPIRSFDRLLHLLPHLPPQSHWQPSGRLALAAALGGSEACCRYVNSRPPIAAAICCGPYTRRRKPLAVMRHELRWRRAASAGEAELEVALRRYRVREWVRIVGRALSGLANSAVVLGELSDLADIIVDTLTHALLRRERSQHGPWPQGAGFAVLAQGKLGAQELNISSDIDVQFLTHQVPSPQASDDRPAHERYTRVAQRLVSGLSRRDDHGFCFRVDVDLRPEGKKGSLVNSLAGAEHYYEVWGQSWERLALIRARHCGGAAWVTRAFTDAVRPFVFPRSLSMGTVEEIRSLKERLHEERKSHSLRHGRAIGVDIKRDTGGIREIELFVQILQLLHGGRMPSLRTPSLIFAMERLHFAGLITQQDKETLMTGYLFLRQCENSLQAVDERQTHRLPDDSEALNHVARCMGRRDGRWLQKKVAAVRRQVGCITRSLFGATPLVQRPHRAVLALAQAGEERCASLARLGFAAPEEAASTLQVLSQRVGGPFSRHAPEHLRHLAAPLLADMAKSPDPDQALRLYGELDPQFRGQPAYLRLLAGTPPLRQRLVDLLGTSEFLARTIIHFPELIDFVGAARDPIALTARDPEALLSTVLQRLAALSDPELQLRSLRRFKLQEQLRIGMLDLAGSLSIEQVQEQLSIVAEVCLQAALALAYHHLQPDHPLGVGPMDGFCVLGMGRLGGREMGYGSDLDLLFIYDTHDSGAPDIRGAVRLAQRLIQHLTLRFPEGDLYAIDIRLRPSGVQGPLVSSGEGFVQYHRTQAMLWERQALLRARPVAGDQRLGQRVLGELAGVRYPKGLPPGARQEIHRLRSRMERELAREVRHQMNVKTGRGALVDLEFIVQIMQLEHAQEHGSLQVTNTVAALHALAACGLLPRRWHRLLVRAYQFLRLLEMRLRIVHNRPITAVDFSQRNADPLARRMGYASRGNLQKDYARVTRLVRRFYEAIFLNMETFPKVRS